MTEERKAVLRELLNEAIDGLKIGIRLGNSSFLLPSNFDGSSNPIEVFFGRGTIPLDKAKFQDYLQKRWTSYGLDISPVLMNFEYYIAKDKTKSQLLEFIQEELTPFIHKDGIQTISYVVDNRLDDEYGLFSLRSSRISMPILLEHLLRIAIAWGVEKAVLTFEDGTCLQGKQDSFQEIVSLEGIVVEEEIQVDDSVRLVPFPSHTTFEFESYFPHFSNRRYSFERQMGKTLLITNRPMLSIFHNPSENTFDGIPVNDIPFQIDTDNIKFPNSDEVNSYRIYFCQALSLACNCAVQISHEWRYAAEDEIFRPFSSGGMGYSPKLFGDSVKVGQSEIKDAKCIYDNLIKLKSKTQGKLRIAIDRWIKSHTYQKPEDKMIDLGVAFESLFLPKNKTDQLSLSLRLRAAWFLGDDKSKRNELMKVFSKIYTWRSKCVHTGELPNKTTNTPYTQEEISEFINNAQDLCQKSIIKFLQIYSEDGEFPNDDYWNDLILG